MQPTNTAILLRCHEDLHDVVRRSLERKKAKIPLTVEWRQIVITTLGMFQGAQELAAQAWETGAEVLSERDRLRLVAGQDQVQALLESIDELDKEPSHG